MSFVNWKLIAGLREISFTKIDLFFRRLVEKSFALGCVKYPTYSRCLHSPRFKSVSWNFQIVFQRYLNFYKESTLLPRALIPMSMWIVSNKNAFKQKKNLQRYLWLIFIIFCMKSFQQIWTLIKENLSKRSYMQKFFSCVQSFEASQSECQAEV